MKGDKLVIEERHVRASSDIMRLLHGRIRDADGRYIVTIAGESGSGKSEIAAVLSDMFSKEGVVTIVLQQDDYFVYPPKTNADMRRKDITHVGLSEVRLDLLDGNLGDIVGLRSEIEKPLVVFDEDRIGQETIHLEEVKLVIVEGTYTSILENVDKHIFIDLTYKDTLKARKRRAREVQDGFLEKILEIEHAIISTHKQAADIIVTKDYEVVERHGEYE